MGVSNLVDFYTYRIEALEKRLEKEKQMRLRAETFAIELCDPHCPKEYKQVVLGELINSEE